MNEIINKKLELLPDKPGCYIYKDDLDNIIYVGKAKNLKNRVRSYFNGTHNKKTQLLINKINDMEFIIVNSEKEALILENNLIKKHKPYYNIKLKDDKSYPYLVITNESHPRIMLTRKYKKNSKNIYFGPYVNIRYANNLKEIIDKIYPLRKCNPVEKRPCMYYQIRECLGPCAKNLTKNDYKENINNIKIFLNGDTRKVLDILNEKMNTYVNNLEFELAAKTHEYIKSINVSLEKQTIASNTHIDRDYIGYFYDDNYICIQIFLARFGGIIERKIEYFDLYDNPEEILSSYLNQYYSFNKKPKELYIETNNTDFLEKLLDVKVISPQKGNNKKIIDTVKNNAEFYLKNEIIIEEEKEKQNLQMLDELAQKIGVNSINNIDAFDNSNIMGQSAVSVKVNFVNGKKNTYGYRKFRINNSNIDDVATMKEVLLKCYNENNLKPDLIIVDGSKNHVVAAVEIIHQKLNLDIKIIGLVKNNRHITEYIITDDFEVINLAKNSDYYLFLKRIQDEVHRFAITYHRSLRTKNMFNSPLDSIKGIGKTRKKLLLEKFSSLNEILLSEDSKLIALGIPKATVTELKKELALKIKNQE
ncbi:excinuclease ABC subunit UvrC [Gemella sp. zg-570]|uniref:excinuclease ABC subunit UvrC n=1 Tax=Gemella sp. zg-570 TaxID=2840371 RepID=UPI001C0AC71D|nr:excinuclease ABC subunit UvrC [Gemella sp. zg-570]QWQ39448.1 excinuclease ABC subunit UvrC [Gemella sp. zg-570]